MWKTWIGFNASHSYGAILFGLVYGYLAIAEGGMFFRSPFLLLVGLLLLVGYVFLGKRYWFGFHFVASFWPRHSTLRHWSSIGLESTPCRRCSASEIPLALQ